MEYYSKQFLIKERLIISSIFIEIINKKFL